MKSNSIVVTKKELPQPRRRQRTRTTCYVDEEYYYYNSFFNYEYHTCICFQKRCCLDRIEKGDLIWVSKSKGLKKTKNNNKKSKNCQEDQNEQQRTGSELFLRAHVLGDLNNNNNNSVAENEDHNHQEQGTQQEQKQQEQQQENTTSKENDNKELIKRHQSSQSQQKQKKKNERILIQYPKGSTYHVRNNLITPIFDIKKQYKLIQATTTTTTTTTITTPKISSSYPPGIIVVVNETYEYRHLCYIHTTPNDIFLEIGCAFGDTCHRVQHLLHDEVPSDEKEKEEGNENKKVQVLGVDKSIDSIEIANKRCYPDDGPKKFVHVNDVLEQPEELKQVCDLYLMKPPTVVAIDINGTRELNAVLKCIDIVLNLWNNSETETETERRTTTRRTTNKTSSTFHDDAVPVPVPVPVPIRLPTPRLIIVKSRTLCAKLVNEA